MAAGYYITHPQVRIDANVPVAEWSLSDVGQKRATAMLAQPWVKAIRRIVSSAERKAIETAQTLSEHIGVPLEIRERMHENDRSATGFLPPAEFETVVEEFFTKPEVNVRGWERAIDAQVRIRSEVDAVLAGNRTGDVAFVGHGGVGTLLFLSLSGLSISRVADQPAGGGNFFAFDLASLRVHDGWRPIDKATT